MLRHEFFEPVLHGVISSVCDLALRLFHLAFGSHVGRGTQAALHLLGRTNQQHVSRLCLRRIDGVGGQLQYARSLYLQGSDTERREILDNFDDLIIVVQVDQVEGEEHPERMNAARRHDPETLVRSQSELSNKPSEAREGGVSRGYTQAEKTFAREVVYAVRPSFHVAPSFLASAGHIPKISMQRRS